MSQESEAMLQLTGRQTAALDVVVDLFLDRPIVTQIVATKARPNRLRCGGTQANLHRGLRRFLGRNRKSRRREAAGRGDSPEAVPKEKCRGKGKDVANQTE